MTERPYLLLCKSYEDDIANKYPVIYHHTHLYFGYEHSLHVKFKMEL